MNPQQHIPDNLIIAAEYALDILRILKPSTVQPVDTENAGDFWDCIDMARKGLQTELDNMREVQR